MQTVPFLDSVQLRRGGLLFLLDADGRVLASQCGSKARSNTLPFGLKRIVERVIAQSRDIFRAGSADFTIPLSLAVRIFSIKQGSISTIALYIERDSRRSDRHVTEP